MVNQYQISKFEVVKKYFFPTSNSYQAVSESKRQNLLRVLVKSSTNLATSVLCCEMFDFERFSRPKITQKLQDVLNFLQLRAKGVAFRFQAQLVMN